MTHDKVQGFPSINKLRICPIGESSASGTTHGTTHNLVGERDPIADLWNGEAARDEKLAAATQAVEQGATRFPVALRLKVSISECSIDDAGSLCFRGRKWVPDSERLRTGIIQHVHDSHMAGHPGVTPLDLIYLD